MDLTISMRWSCRLFQTSSADNRVLFEKELYVGLEEDVLITVNDHDANRDPTLIENVVVAVGSEETDMFGEEIILIETGVNTGIFQGRFNITRLNQKLKNTY